jgi:hypothetical protein
LLVSGTLLVTCKQADQHVAVQALCPQESDAMRRQASVAVAPATERSVALRQHASDCRIRIAKKEEHIFRIIIQTRCCSMRIPRLYVLYLSLQREHYEY